MKKNSSDQGVINAFKKSIKGFFKIKDAGDLTGTTVNIGETITATLTTDWTTEFRNDPINLNDNVTDSFNNIYTTTNIAGRLWTTSNWKGTYNGNYDWGNANKKGNFYLFA